MAREINTKVAREFAKRCEDIASDVLSIWGETSCYWDNSPFAIRQFVLTAHHSWGTAYCYWDERHKWELTDKLKEAGATNIKIRMKWNRVDCSFNLTVTEQKRLEKEA